MVLSPTRTHKKASAASLGLVDGKARSGGSEGPSAFPYEFSGIRVFANKRAGALHLDLLTDLSRGEEGRPPG